MPKQRRCSTSARTTPRSGPGGARGLHARPLRGDAGLGRVRAGLPAPGPGRRSPSRHPLPRLVAVRDRSNDDPNQYLFYTNTFADPRTTTRSSASGPTRSMLTRFFRDFLLAQQPDIDPLPAHDLPRLRPAPRDQEHAARRADRLHAARVPADLPPRRADGAHLQRGALPGGVAAALPRVLPAASARRPSTCASASSSPTCRWSTSSSRPATTCATATWTGASRPRRSRSSRRACCRSADRLPEEPETRPRNRFAFFGQFNPVQGRRRAAGGDGDPRRRLRRPPLDLRREPGDPADRVPGALRRAARAETGTRHVRRAPTSALDLAS